MDNSTILLQQILTELQKMNAPKLGLLDTNDEPMYIYCNRSRECLWYYLDSQREAVPLDGKTLSGYVVKVEIKSVERRKKETAKLHVWVSDSQRRYCLEAGIETTFAKGLVSAIDAADLSQPVSIKPRAGESDEVLLCRVSQYGQSIYAPYNAAGINIPAIVAQLQRRLEHLYPQQTQQNEPEQEQSFEIPPVSRQSAPAPTPAPAPVPPPSYEGGMVDLFKQGLTCSQGLNDLITLANWMNQSEVRSGLFEIPQMKAWVLEQLSIKASALKVERDELMYYSTTEMQRLNWSTERGRQCLQAEFRKGSRHDLTLGELLSFIGLLMNITQPELAVV